MRRTVWLGCAVLVALGLMAGPAAAEIAQFDIAARGVVRDGKAIVHGEIKCSSSDRYRVRVVVTKDGRELSGATSGDCHGAPQTWRVVAKDATDRATAGSWRICATPGDTSGDREPVCRRIRLVQR